MNPKSTDCEADALTTTPPRRSVRCVLFNLLNEWIHSFAKYFGQLKTAAKIHHSFMYNRQFSKLALVTTGDIEKKPRQPDVAKEELRIWCCCCLQRWTSFLLFFLWYARSLDLRLPTFFRLCSTIADKSPIP